MPVPLSPPEFQRLIRILQGQPEFRDADRRNALVTLAFGMDEKAEVIRGRANLSGSPMTAAVELVSLLVKFGQVRPGTESLGVLLDHLMMNLGDGEDSNFLMDLIHKYQLIVPPPPPIPPIHELPKPAPRPGAEGKYIFVSYARPERLIAEQIEKFLESAGIRAFRDVSDVRASDNWDMEIEQALNEATHMVLVLSASSMPFRKEVYREWFYYDQKQKPIIPLYVQECTLHSRLIARQYIDARENFAAALAQVLDQIC